jgi:hypothetical protein
VANPVALVSGCLCGPDVRDERCNSVRFTLDIDGDGADEEFIGIREAMGNAGGEHFVFRREGDSYRCLGSILLYPLAVKVVSSDPPSLIIYWRLGADEGLLRTVTLTPAGFCVAAERTIKPSTDDAQVFLGLFAGRP